MDRSPKQTFHQRRYTDGQKAHEKMLNITNYQRNTNHNMEVPPHKHWSESSSLVILQITNPRKGVEKTDPSCTTGGNVNWYNHYGKQYGDTSENQIQDYHMIQQSQSQAYIQIKLSFKKRYMHPYVHSRTIHNSQDMETT